jgi:hypothetical protein
MPGHADIWVQHADAGFDTISHFKERRDLCNLFLSSLENELPDGQQKRLYIAALTQYLAAIEAGIDRLNQDPPNAGVDRGPKGPKGRRTGDEPVELVPDAPDALVPGGTLARSKATLQTIDRMISIICAREH